MNYITRTLAYVTPSITSPFSEQDRSDLLDEMSCKGCKFINPDIAAKIMEYLNPLQKTAIARTSKSFYAARQISIQNEEEIYKFYKVNLAASRPNWLPKKFVSSDGRLTSSTEFLEQCIDNIASQDNSLRERTNRLVFFFYHPKFADNTSVDTVLRFTTRQPTSVSVINPPPEMPYSIESIANKVLSVIPFLNKSAKYETPLQIRLEEARRQAKLNPSDDPNAEEPFAYGRGEVFRFDPYILKNHCCEFSWVTKQNVPIGRYLDGKHIIQQGCDTSSSTTCAAMILLDHQISCDILELITSRHKSCGEQQEIPSLLKEYNLKVEEFSCKKINIKQLKALLDKHGSLYIYSHEIRNFIIDYMDHKKITLRVPKHGYRIDVPIDKFFENMCYDFFATAVIKQKLSPSFFEKNSRKLASDISIATQH